MRPGACSWGRTAGRGAGGQGVQTIRTLCAFKDAWSPCLLQDMLYIYIYIYIQCHLAAFVLGTGKSDGKQRQQTGRF